MKEIIISNNKKGSTASNTPECKWPGPISETTIVLVH